MWYNMDGVIVDILILLAASLATTGLLFLCAALLIRTIDFKLPGDK